MRAVIFWKAKRNPSRYCQCGYLEFGASHSEVQQLAITANIICEFDCIQWSVCLPLHNFWGLVKWRACFLDLQILHQSRSQRCDFQRMFTRLRYTEDLLLIVWNHSWNQLANAHSSPALGNIVCSFVIRSRKSQLLDFHCAISMSQEIKLTNQEPGGFWLVDEN